MRNAFRTAIAASSPLALAGTAHAQTTERVSVSTGGRQGNGVSFVGTLSADGRYVAFTSFASNLGGPNGNGDDSDVYVHDRQADVTTLISVGAGGRGADSFSDQPFISRNGRYVAFLSNASNLVAGEDPEFRGGYGAYIRDRQSGTTIRVDVGLGGAEPDEGILALWGISGDARHVLFSSNATNLVAGDDNGRRGLFLRDRRAGTTTIVSLSDSDQPIDAPQEAAISANGRFIVFTASGAGIAPGPSSARLQVYLRDRQAGTTRLVSVSGTGRPDNRGSGNPFVSDDGQIVAFESRATNLVPADTNNLGDVFVRNLRLGTTTRISVGPGRTQASESSSVAGISADGRLIAFFSEASDIVRGDTNGTSDVFVYDRGSGTTRRVSLGVSGQQANDLSIGGDASIISADGSTVGFSSTASNLVPNDTAGQTDVFVRTR